MMRISFFTFVAFFSAVAVLAVACTSTTDPSEGRLVGKSSYTKPIWASKGLKVPDTGNTSMLSYSKTRVFQLELGIKQAQAEALSHVYRTFDREFANYVGQVIDEHTAESRGESLGGATRAKVLQGAIQASKEFGAPVLRPESVYWEEREVQEDGGSSGKAVVRFYKIWVLVTLETAEITDRVSVLLDQLEKSQAKEFAPAVDALSKKYKRLTGGDDDMPGEGNDDE